MNFRNWPRGEKKKKIMESYLTFFQSKTQTLILIGMLGIKELLLQDPSL